MFLKAVDVWDREKVVLLLEDDYGLIRNWSMVKKVCNRFVKRREWNDEVSSSSQTSMGSFGEAHERRGGKAPHDRGETNARVALERTVVEAPSRGSEIDELMKMVGTST